MRRSLRFITAVVIAIGTLFVSASAVELTEQQEIAVNAYRRELDAWYIYSQLTRNELLQDYNKLNRNYVTWDDVIEDYNTTTDMVETGISFTQRFVKQAYKNAELAFRFVFNGDGFAGAGGSSRGGGAGRILYTDGTSKYVIKPNLTEEDAEIFYDIAYEALTSPGYIEYIGTKETIVSGAFSPIGLIQSNVYPNTTTAYVYKVTGDFDTIELRPSDTGTNLLYINNVLRRTIPYPSASLRVGFSKSPDTLTYYVCGDSNYQNDLTALNVTSGTAASKIISSELVRDYFTGSGTVEWYYGENIGTVGIPMYNDGDYVSEESVFHNMFSSDSNYHRDSNGIITGTRQLYDNNQILIEYPYMGVNLDKAYSQDGLLYNPSSVSSSASGEIADPSQIIPDNRVTPSPVPTDEIDDDTSGAIEDGWTIGNIISGLFGGLTNFFTNTLKNAFEGVVSAISNFFNGMSNMFTGIDNYVDNTDVEVKSVGTTGGAFVNLFGILPYQVQQFLVLSAFLLVLIVIMKIFL